MVKKLLKGVREYKRASIFTMVFAGLEVVMEIVVPFLMASIIDQGIYGGNMNTLLKLGLYMVLCVIIGLIFGLVAEDCRQTLRQALPKTSEKTCIFISRDFPLQTSINFQQPVL